MLLLCAVFGSGSFGLGCEERFDGLDASDAFRLTSLLERTPASWSAELGTMRLVDDFDGDGDADVAFLKANQVEVATQKSPRLVPVVWAQWAHTATTPTFTGDFDGDGRHRADIVIFDIGADSAVQVAVSNGEGFSVSGWATMSLKADDRVLVGDFNGDGRSDFARLDPVAGRVLGGLSTGSSFLLEDWGALAFAPSERLITGDFNGDGRTDIAHLVNGTPAPVTVHLSRPRGSSVTFDSASWGAWTFHDGTRLVAADFNGDGLTDVAKLDLGRRAGIWVGVSNGGDGFVIREWGKWNLPVSAEVFTGDFNADGREDLGRVEAGKSEGAVWIGLASQSGTFPGFEKWGELPPAKYLGALFSRDLNGDGSSDLAAIHERGRTKIVFGLSPCPEPWPATTLQPGEQYEIVFASAPDDGAPVGASWTGESLKRSIADAMFRAAVLKMDDLRGDVTPEFARAIQTLTEKRVPHTVGVIADGLDRAPPENLACLARRDQQQTEIWNHGLNHYADKTSCEFTHYSRTQQFRHLRKAQDLIRSYLGVTMKTWGAPCNSFDERTTSALEEVSAIETLYLAEVRGRMTHPLNRFFQFEPSSQISNAYALATVLHVYERDCFSRQCPSGVSDTPMIIEIHPNLRSEREWEDLLSFVDYVRADGRAFMTAPMYRAWLLNSPRVTLRKQSATVYELDMRLAVREQVVAFRGPPILSIRPLATETEVAGRAEVPRVRNVPVARTDRGATGPGPPR